MAESKGIADQIIDFLASVKLALTVLFTMAAAAVAGTIIPQNLDPRQYLEAHGPVLYTFLSYLDMYNMYSSWWFNLLMAVLVVNLIVCSAKRIPKAYRLARPTDPSKVKPAFLKNQSFSEVMTIPFSSISATTCSILTRVQNCS